MKTSKWLIWKRNYKNSNSKLNWWCLIQVMSWLNRLDRPSIKIWISICLRFERNLNIKSNFVKKWKHGWIRKNMRIKTGSHSKNNKTVKMQSTRQLVASITSDLKHQTSTRNPYQANPLLFKDSIWFYKKINCQQLRNKRITKLLCVPSNQKR